MFKVWDKVVCVNAADSGDSLVSGKTYTIGDVQEEYVVLEEDENGYAWMASRFQLALDIDPLVEIHQSEYDSLIEEINLLQELLAEANEKLVAMTVFKPIVEYTMEDWEQALCNDWKFEQRDGEVINIIGLDYSDTNYKVETETSWLRLDGSEYDFGYSDSDIIKRIK